jgi:hypothetical protein
MFTKIIATLWHFELRRYKDMKCHASSYFAEAYVISNSKFAKMKAPYPLLPA